MAENSKIEWTTHTFNPWMGCTKVSPGCKHCYAETLMDERYGKVKWGPQGKRIRTSQAYWRKPIQWNKDTTPDRQRVFVASLADVCELHPTIDPAWRMDLVALVLECPNLDWLFLTKRPENFNDLYLDLFGGKLPDNLWVGTSVEDQKNADLRIPELLKIPAPVRFLSCEPLLAPIDLTKIPIENSDVTMNVLHRASIFAPHIHWVIAGGESGADARSMNPKWVRDLRDQCVEAGVAFHFKQWGEWHYDDEIVKYRPNVPVSTASGWPMYRVGKHTAGRLLDGRTWDEYPR